MIDEKIIERLEEKINDDICEAISIKLKDGTTKKGKKYELQLTITRNQEDWIDG